MKYFPDSCLKKVPDRNYFWRVLGVVMPREYNAFLKDKVLTLRHRRRFPIDRIALTREAEEIFEGFDFENRLSLLSLLTS